MLSEFWKYWPNSILEFRGDIMKDLNYYLQLKYPIVITQDDDGSYLAEYPDLKGCISVGSTIEGSIAMINDAKLAWLTAAIENNIFIPEPREVSSFSGNFKIRLPRSLHKELSETARKEGISMNQLCLYLLSKELEHHCLS
jgi:antitoxin HicB